MSNYNYPSIGEIVNVISNETMKSVCKGKLEKFTKDTIVINLSTPFYDFSQIFDAKTHHFQGYEPPAMLIRDRSNKRLIEKPKTNSKSKTTLREEIKQFSTLMNSRLQQNSYKDEVGWKNLSKDHLIYYIRKNLLNLDASDNEIEIVTHATDVANYAMMIADNCRRDSDANS